jgi:hypothetical protein
MFAKSIGFLIIAPASTGSICCNAPNIIIVKIPRVKRCISPIVVGENLLKIISAGLLKISNPIKIPKIGAVRKNLNGTEIGGA